MARPHRAARDGARSGRVRELARGRQGSLVAGHHPAVAFHGRRPRLLDGNHHGALHEQPHRRRLWRYLRRDGRAQPVARLQGADHVVTARGGLSRSDFTLRANPCHTTPVSPVGPARSASVQPASSTSRPCPTAIRATGFAPAEHVARLNKTPWTNSVRQTRETRLAMEPVVIACGGCGAAIRIRHPEIARRRVCPRCHAHLTRDQDSVCRQSLPQQAISALEPTADQTERQQSSRTRHVPREGKWMARPAGILIAALLLATGAMLGALTSASRSATSRVRGESPQAGPDTAPAQLAPAAELPPSPTLLAMRSTTNEGEDVKMAPAAPPLPHTLAAPHLSHTPAAPPVPCTPAAPRTAAVAQPPRTSLLAEPRFRPRLSAKAVRPVSDEKGMARNGDQAAAKPQRAVPVLIELAAATAAGLDQAPPPEPPRFKVKDEQGQPVVARLHGQHEGTTALILPDGQLGFPNMLVPTNEPFQPFTAEELLERLQKGP